MPREGVFVSSYPITTSIRLYLSFDLSTGVCLPIDTKSKLAIHKKEMPSKRKKRIGRREEKGDVVVPRGSATRLATPFTIKCLSCGGYIYKNKRHNALKETAIGKDYLGIESYRFHIKCTGCMAPLTIRTDPKNGVYVTENGCARAGEEEEAKEGSGKCDIPSMLRRESDMKDEIGRLKMQMGFVSSSCLKIIDTDLQKKEESLRSSALEGEKEERKNLHPLEDEEMHG